MIDALDVKRIGYMETDLLPSFVSLEKNRLSLPFELFKFKDFVIFLAKIQPAQSEINEITKKLSNWVVTNKLSESILIGGLDSKLKEEDEKLKIVPTKKFSNPERIGSNLDKGLFVTGPLALMLIYFEMMEFPACAILPYCERERPDPRAAATAIQTLNNLYPNLKIDVEKLYGDAKKIEEEIGSILKQEREMREREEPGGMYV